MNEVDALRRLAGARVARLATADLGGIPHVVPVVFAVEGRTLYWAVDDKPKRSRRLKRLANIGQNPNVELVVDHYVEDWPALWWVRAGGTARVVDDERERTRAIVLLQEKYEQYRTTPPRGPVVAVELTRVTGWTGAPSGS